MNALDIILWIVLPYLSIVILIAGLIWRYRTDQFGWTSRSSQIYERRILRWSSPLFHIGMLFVFIGHLMGLAIPESWTSAIGISEYAYHLIATIPGTIAALMVIVGLAGLIWRRIVNKSVRLATSPMDKVMYVLLSIPILLGGAATVIHQIFGGGYDYRQTISPWFRSIALLHPDPQLMLSVPLVYQLHIIAGMLLLCLWPFTRLVHVVSAPVGYVSRPHVVYRSRRPATSTTPRRRGW
ncbi:respiratory nitrate reductase subunit gamma [Devriesea agamarum]|uniref:respiratory nitrate reductase subunit gamma n=1 Tax=Devriesea agamarum TaxID=472569 RepID=UPI00071DCD02|nr:respiratory nitrate reductase subunit gamma [Devriesea agamarum]